MCIFISIFIDSSSFLQQDLKECGANCQTNNGCKCVGEKGSRVSIVHSKRIRKDKKHKKKRKSIKNQILDSDLGNTNNNECKYVGKKKCTVCLFRV